MLAAIMGGIVFFAIFGYVIYDVLQDPGDAAKNIVYDWYELLFQKYGWSVQTF